jgi:hypothetical protein
MKTAISAVLSATLILSGSVARAQSAEEPGDHRSEIMQSAAKLKKLKSYLAAGVTLGVDAVGAYVVFKNMKSYLDCKSSLRRWLADMLRSRGYSVAPDGITRWERVDNGLKVDFQGVESAKMKTHTIGPKYETLPLVKGRELDQLVTLTSRARWIRNAGVVVMGAVTLGALVYVIVQNSQDDAVAALTEENLDEERLNQVLSVDMSTFDGINPSTLPAPVKILLQNQSVRNAIQIAFDGADASLKQLTAKSY